MRIDVLQHVPFEGPGAIADWCTARGHMLTIHHLYLGQPAPAPSDTDMLVVMGGPMGVADTDDHPWLVGEKAALRTIIAAQKPVIGVCLGAQLIAEALGAAVTRNPHKEIGWYPIALTPEAARTHVFGKLPPRMTVFHWHGDTFGIPCEAIRLAGSEACQNQAFLYGSRVLALQFHMESTPDGIAALTIHAADELVPTPYVQRREQMLAADSASFERMHTLLFDILDRLV